MQPDALVAAPKSTFDPDPEIPLFFPLPVRPARRGEARSLLAAEPEAEAEEENEDGYGGQGYGGHGGHGSQGGPGGYSREGEGGLQGGHGPRDSTHPSRPWVHRAAPVVDPMEAVKSAPKRFVADESDADMKRRWEQRRRELTQGWKRRHREAVKHRKRRGGEE